MCTSSLCSGGVLWQNSLENFLAKYLHANIKIGTRPKILSKIFKRNFSLIYLQFSRKCCIFAPEKQNTKSKTHMKYRIKKETKPTLSTFGKYKAVAVHHQTIGQEMILEETAKRAHVDQGTVKGIIITLAEVVNSHLRDGDRVRLPDWGLLKLEIESDKVDDPKTFRAKKHIRGVRLHFLPESYEGSQPLYSGLTFEKDKNHIIK